MSKDLPQGWACASLNELIIFMLGGDWGTDPAQSGEGFAKVRVIRGTEFKTWRTEKGAKAAERRVKISSLEKRRLREGDLVLEVSGGGPNQPVGRTVLIDDEALKRAGAPMVCSNFFRLLRFHPDIDPRFVYQALALSHSRGAFNEFQTETTNLRNLNVPDFLQKTEIPLAPLPEQRRIVAKLEQLLAKVDACQQRLAKIPLLLKRFRQSVLAAACSGRLTADWREENPAAGTGSGFLQKIQPERRRIWEDTQKQRRAADLDFATDKWKLRYKPPTLGTLKDKDGLPSSWTWEKLDAVLACIEAGKSFTCEERPPEQNEVGVLKVSAVTWGEFDENESKTCKDQRRINATIQVRAGDLLFSRANTIELVGACVIVRKVSSNVMLSDKTLRLQLAGAPKEYILYALRAPTGRTEIESLATGNQNSMRNIGQERIREISVPFPPLPEQHEIVRRVETLFSLADQIESRFEKARQQTGKLTPSLLARAFRGELVPQDPNDEPAAKLLERIRDSSPAHK